MKTRGKNSVLVRNYFVKLEKISSFWCHMVLQKRNVRCRNFIRNLSIFIKKKNIRF